LNTKSLAQPMTLMLVQFSYSWRCKGGS